MFLRQNTILKGNLAFMPLMLLLNLLGFYLKTTNKYKFFRMIHSVSFIILLLFVVSPSVQYKDETSMVVSTITYINTRCIYYALIIIYIRNMIARISLSTIFKCLDNSDQRLQTIFDIKIKDDESSWFIRIMIILLFISAFWSFVFECCSNKIEYNVGQLVHAMLVFTLSVKILFYCMLCASIKVRFIALIKHLKEIKSSQTSFVVNTTTTKYIAVTKSIEKLSQLKEVSLIYDEVLEIILLLNESFSTLLSFAFGTLFLFLTLNSFCTFFMMTTKNFTIFQLIEKAHWILLSAFAIFSLCYTTESTNKAISDCASLLNTIYSHDDFENINHKVEIEIILTKIIIQMESFVFTCGYFDINMKMLHSFVYTSITYLVILLQFNFEEVETSSPPTIAH